MVKSLLQRLGGMLRMMRAGGVLAAASLVAAGIAPSWPLQLLAFVGLGFGFYAVHNSIQTQATELAPDNRGAAIALHAFFFFLGQATGPIAYRIALGLLGAGAATLLAALSLLAMAFWLARRLAKAAP
jgi:predicted MFS family arabinose efflux permease